MSCGIKVKHRGRSGGSILILVTGGTGFVGSYLVRKLVYENYKVACVYRNSTDFTRVRDLYHQITWIDNKEEKITEAFNSYEIEGIIHCATSYGRGNATFFDVMKTNVQLPLFLLELANEKKVNFFINTDSFFTRELGDKWVKNSKVYMNSYTKSKYIFRETARENVENLDLSFINCELQHIYGCADNSGKFVSFLYNELVNDVPEIDLTEGEQTRDWTHVDDVVDAFIAIVKNVDNFERRKFYEFQIGTGIETSLKDFCLEMRKHSGSHTKLRFGRLKMQENEIMHAVADNSSLLALGWKPKVSLEEGIARMFNR